MTSITWAIAKCIMILSPIFPCRTLTIIEELLDRVERREFLNDADDLVDNALNPVEGIINAPLPQEWKTSFISRT
jgi:hypothetical protein